LTLMPCNTVGQGKLLCRPFCTVMRQPLLSSGNSHVHGIDVTWGGGNPKGQNPEGA
jgi:hypothetical protein